MARVRPLTTLTKVFLLFLLSIILRIRVRARVMAEGAGHVMCHVVLLMANRGDLTMASLE